MKRHLTVLALGASFLTASSMFGQNNPAVNVPGLSSPTPQPQQQKLVHISTIDGIEANREFQANVQLVQTQRQAAIELNARMEQEKDAKKKAELKKQLDDLLAKLSENNEKMAKTYGFSLTRNYTMVIEKSHIYMLVSDEEAAKIEQEVKARESAEKKAKK